MGWLNYSIRFLQYQSMLLMFIHPLKHIKETPTRCKVLFLLWGARVIAHTWGARAILLFWFHLVGYLIICNAAITFVTSVVIPFKQGRFADIGTPADLSKMIGDTKPQTVSPEVAMILVFVLIL